MRGKHPREWHCFTMEKEAEITAWLATIDASVATMNTGQKTASERAQTGIKIVDV